MELFWEYRPLNNKRPKGACDWFQRDTSVERELVLIRVTLIPMLVEAEQLGAAEGQRRAFDRYARGRLLEFKEFVEGYWKATNTSVPVHVDPEKRGNMTEMVSRTDGNMAAMLAVLGTYAVDCNV